MELQSSENEYIQTEFKYDLPTLENIIKNGNINEQDEQGNTILYYACDNNNYQIVKLLLDAGADPNISSSNQILSKPFVRNLINNIITEKYNLEIFNLLLDAKVSGCEYILDYIICKSGYTTTLLFSSNIERTKLYILSIINLLLSKNVDPNRGNMLIYFLLLCNIFNFDKLKIIETIKLFLDKGANINMQTYMGMNPLMLACSFKFDIEIIKLLLNTDLYHTMDDGSTILILLCKRFAFDSNPSQLIHIIKLVLEHLNN